MLVIGISGKIGSITAKNVLAKSNISLIQQADSCDHQCNIESHYTITKTELAKHIDSKPRLFIDLAVPNDMDPHLQ